MNWVVKKDIGLLKDFLAGAGKSLKYFTFYISRDVEYIEQLDRAVFGVLEGKPVSYGHLDFIEGEESGRWIGLCVSEAFTGSGYGTLLLKRLEDLAVSSGVRMLRLSVYKNNTIAKTLYDSNSYTVVGDNGRSYFMEKEL